MENMNEFGTNMVEVRESLGINRTELQRALAENGHELHMTTLRRIEAGEQEPKVSEAVWIAEALGVSVELLMMEAKNHPKLRDVELAHAKYKEAVKDVVLALSRWEKEGKTLHTQLKIAKRAGTPEKLLYDAANTLGQSDDIDGIIYIWEKSTDKSRDWFEHLTKES